MYILYILRLNSSLAQLSRRPMPAPATRYNDFSVIVPFRNEVDNLPRLIGHLSVLDYPKDRYRVLLVDDGSSDNGPELALRYAAEHAHVSYFKNPGKGKKAAIKKGVEEATTQHIVLTDADCGQAPDWLKGINDHLEANDPALLIMPVITSKARGATGKMQELEYLSLVGATFGAWKDPVLCSAANLCFKKEAFLKHNPYAGNWHIPTGDDIFLLQALKGREKINGSLDPRVWVYTSVPEGLSGFWEQRVRWGSKAVNYRDRQSVLVAMMVLAVNTLLAGLLIFLPRISPIVFASLFAAKCVADFMLLGTASRIFGKRYLMNFFIPVAIIYLFYVPLAAVAGMLRNLTRYGRR